VAAFAAGAAVAPAAAAAPGSTLRKGPYLQDLGPDAVSVRLELDPPGRAALEVEGPAAEDRRVPGGDRPAAFQAFAVTGLQPRTTYRYRVVLLDAKETRPPAGEGSFTTAPRAGDPAPVSFLVYGDDRTDDAAHAAVVRALVDAARPRPAADGGSNADASANAHANAADFLVNTGDFVEDGSNELLWQRFFAIERPLLRDHCVFASVGNHELVQATGESFLRYFGDGADAAAAPGVVGAGESSPRERAEQGRRRFVRTVRWGEVLVLFLNGLDTFASTGDRRWLDGELARADLEPGITFRLVVLHHGPYSSGPHGKNARLWSSGVVDLLRRHRVDLVVSGHDHIYERGEADGLKYVVSGGGGAPLYPIRKRLATSRVAESVFHFIEVTIAGQRFDLVTRRVDGSVVDRCGFSKGGAWDCDAASGRLASASSGRSSSAARSRGAAGSPAASGSRCGCAVPSAQPIAGDRVLLGLALAFGLARARRRKR
jgi:3',5'-cyclic AMP phosphodiesterase CpdA